MDKEMILKLCLSYTNKNSVQSIEDLEMDKTVTYLFRFIAADSPKKDKNYVSTMPS